MLEDRRKSQTDAQVETEEKEEELKKSAWPKPPVDEDPMPMQKGGRKPSSKLPRKTSTKSSRVSSSRKSLSSGGSSKPGSTPRSSRSIFASSRKSSSRKSGSSSVASSGGKKSTTSKKSLSSPKSVSSKKSSAGSSKKSAGSSKSSPKPGSKTNSTKKSDSSSGKKSSWKPPMEDASETEGEMTEETTMGTPTESTMETTMGDGEGTEESGRGRIDYSGDITESREPLSRASPDSYEILKGRNPEEYDDESEYTIESTEEVTEDADLMGGAIQEEAEETDEPDTPNESGNLESQGSFGSSTAKKVRFSARIDTNSPDETPETDDDNIGDSNEFNNEPNNERRELEGGEEAALADVPTNDNASAGSISSSVYDSIEIALPPPRVDDQAAGDMTGNGNEQNADPFDDLDDVDLSDSDDPEEVPEDPFARQDSGMNTSPTKSSQASSEDDDLEATYDVEELDSPKKRLFDLEEEEGEDDSGDIDEIGGPPRQSTGFGINEDPTSEATSDQDSMTAASSIPSNTSNTIEATSSANPSDTVPSHLPASESLKSRNGVDQTSSTASATVTITRSSPPTRSSQSSLKNLLKRLTKASK